MMTKKAFAGGAYTAAFGYLYRAAHQAEVRRKLLGQPNLYNETSGAYVYIDQLVSQIQATCLDDSDGSTSGLVSSTASLGFPSAFNTYDSRGTAEHSHSQGGPISSILIRQVLADMLSCTGRGAEWICVAARRFKSLPP